MLTDGPMGREIFFAYLRHFLCPTLKPGDWVIVDNLGSHKVAGVKETSAAAGATFLYLPPYSPDLNPIEKAFRQAQSSAPQSRGPHHRCPLGGDWPNAYQPLAHGVRQLLRLFRIVNT